MRNRELKRRALTQDEIRHEVEILVDQGHKRVLLVAGESYPREGFRYVLDSIATVYAVKRDDSLVPMRERLRPEGEIAETQERRAD